MPPVVIYSGIRLLPVCRSSGKTLTIYGNTHTYTKKNWYWVGCVRYHCSHVHVLSRWSHAVNAWTLPNISLQSNFQIMKHKVTPIHLLVRSHNLCSQELKQQWHSWEQHKVSHLNFPTTSRRQKQPDDGLNVQRNDSSTSKTSDRKQERWSRFSNNNVSPRNTERDLTACPGRRRGDTYTHIAEWKILRGSRR